MIVTYLLSAPGQDIALGPSGLSRPFKLSPDETHPFLTLGHYFKAIEIFLLEERREALLTLLSENLGKRLSLDDITEVLIRSEKHGALYHVASVELSCDGGSFKFALSTAVSHSREQWLAREFEALSHLHERFNLPHLPRVHFKGEVELQVGGRKELLSMMLSEWFEGYHEWHLTKSGHQGDTKICIWDQGQGRRLATAREGREIFRQASKILTCFYDVRSFRRIHPWHHAGGDFVVQTRAGAEDVKLTTVRSYEPFMVFGSEDRINPITALIYFFLDLTIRMRIDKLDGVGKAIWADDSAVEAVIRGFFEGLPLTLRQETQHVGETQDLLGLLRTFDPMEFEKLFHPLMDFYEGMNPEDLHLVNTHLKYHIMALHAALQDFHLESRSPAR